MVRRRQRERSLFEVLLPDGHKLWPDWLRKIDIGKAKFHVTLRSSDGTRRRKACANSPAGSTE